MERITEDQYLTVRLDEQLAWYDRKSSWNQKWFRRVQMVQIVVSALIPFISGLGGILPGNWGLILVGAMGMVIAVATATSTLYKFQENWVQYRATAEQLRHERFMFLTGVEPYSGGGSFDFLVQRVEGLISKENAAWAKAAQEKSDKKDDAKTTVAASTSPSPAATPAAPVKSTP